MKSGPACKECEEVHPQCICLRCKRDTEQAVPCCVKHDVWCTDTYCRDFVPEYKKHTNYIDYDISRRAVQIAAGKLREAGVCRYKSPTQCRRTFVPTDRDCVDCLERWLLLKAQKQIIRERK